MPPQETVGLKGELSSSESRSSCVLARGQHGLRRRAVRGAGSQRQEQPHPVDVGDGRARHVSLSRALLDIYADLFDEDLDGVANRLDAAIQATADGIGCVLCVDCADLLKPDGPQRS